ncbi:hypothetical protein [Actinomadura terrae]|uniref:hypothetical protein n=1 Tax=Actinomadura terrae TaxID=604353 RepID=UPI001FA745DA|nr:hypothetical protein [Actinomadura terrae]
MSLISHLSFGKLGDWCAERFTGSVEVAQRVSIETKGQEIVRPEAPAGRRQWARVDRTFALRVAALVQPAPPYSALYGLVRTGLVRPEWGHWQAARYPTHIRLAAAERARALDLRPTPTGWLDLTGQRSVEIPLGDDRLSKFKSFHGLMSEPMLGDFFERSRAYLAMHAPLGQLGAEKGVVRLCWLLSMLEYLYRNNPIDEHIYQLLRDGTPTVEQLHATADEGTVAEVVALVRKLHTSGGLAEMRRLAGNPPPGRPWGIARPVFASYWADNDVLVGGPDGTTLIDVSSVGHTNKLRQSQRWIWRLLACAWLDTSDVYRIRNVAIYFARHGVLVAWPVEALAEALLEGDDLMSARREFLALADDLGGRAVPSAG